MEPQSKFRKNKVRDTIVFFGSARIKSRKEALKNLRKLKKENASRNNIKDAELNVEMSRYYEDTARLSYLITKWSKKLEPGNRFVVCSGGGPGIMEASNLGAYKAGGKSIGLNISLPSEQEPNSYISPDLNFEFHYFFMRKFWFAYLAKGLVMMPGGFGTMDELFEILTLVQTLKIKKKMPIVLFDRKFWGKVFNFNELVKKRLIDKEDLKLFRLVNTVDEAFDYLKKELSRNYIDIKSSLFNLKKVDYDS